MDDLWHEGQRPRRASNAILQRVDPGGASHPCLDRPIPQSQPSPPLPQRRSRRRATLALALAFLGVPTGCVHTYQPMSGLHRPVVIDTQAGNFRDIRLIVHCVPGELLSVMETRGLCKKVGQLFENQGAQVRTITTRSQLRAGAADGVFSETDDAGVQSTEPTDLVLELRARELHSADSPLLWSLCMATFTLVPAVTETTFAQDVIIRDGTGFLLISDTLQGRIVRRFGVGVWAGNKLLDRFWRDEVDQLTEDSLERDLSADLYQQLSQLLFNARMHWLVLQESPPIPQTERTSWE